MINNYVLGINFLHSDTSACIFKNNELIAATEEERYTRVKHTSSFPYNSIKYCLNDAGINISEVDTITINSNPFASFLNKAFFILKNPKAIKIAINSLVNMKKKISIKSYISKIDDKYKFKGKLNFVDHHESHIASSLYFSNFDNCVNLSLDGFGDFASCAWGMYDKNSLVIDKKIYFPNSLGIFYQAMTQFLGFKNYGDEYKVMGLSSYGEPKYVDKLSKLIFKDGEGFKLNLDYFIHHKEKILFINDRGQAVYKNLYSKKIYELLGSERKKDDKILKEHIDLAKSTQTIYEEIFFHILKNLHKKYLNDNLSLSGGCIMNSVANGKIFKNTSFKKIYISPNPGDAGGSVGSASTYIKKNYKDSIKVKNYAYLGNSYESSEVKKLLDKNNIKNKFRIDKLQGEEFYNKVANYLIDSKIVGWFQNRMEWGPRALGNRSILADARNPNIKEIINSKIKKRESFRPFAPSILNENLSEWFEVKKEVPYMSEVYKIRKDKRAALPGITHVDGTGRLQTVKMENNLEYYNLIKTFFRMTGVPILLNTSFNENEPIVNKPEEALNCFIRTNMDVLVLKNWIISR